MRYILLFPRAGRGSFDSRVWGSANGCGNDCDARECSQREVGGFITRGHVTDAINTWIHWIVITGL